MHGICTGLPDHSRSWGPFELCCCYVQVQKLTDKFVADIDSLGDAKEKELNKLIL